MAHWHLVITLHSPFHAAYSSYQHVFVMFIFYKMIKINKLAEVLKNEFEKSTNREIIRTNRDYLMWLLLQYVSGAVAAGKALEG